MNYIERMELELKELLEKIKKGMEFRNEEAKEPKFTDEEDRTNLMVQLTYMINYSTLLAHRIKKAKEKEVE
ncbi:MAG: crAss001_48 related protein [Fusobacteriaceae bacterium]